MMCAVGTVNIIIMTVNILVIDSIYVIRDIENNLKYESYHEI